MKFWNLVNSADGHELRIDGEIVMEQDFWDWLFGLPDKSAPALIRDIEALDGGPLTVWINSPGGEVIAGSSIYTALRNYKGFVTVKIDGAAYSAASVIAMAGDKIYISPTALMMIHNPMTRAEGDEKVFEKAFRMLRECKESIINAYVKRTGLTHDEISELMDEDKFMSADEAVKLGFADGILFDAEGEPEVAPTIANLEKLGRTLWNAVKPNIGGAERLQAIMNKYTDPGNGEPDPDEAKYQQALAALDFERIRY